MNRRAFFALLLALPFVRRIALTKPAASAHELGFVDVRDPQTGIAIRFIKHFDIQSAQRPTRRDWIWNGVPMT